MTYNLFKVGVLCLFSSIVIGQNRNDIQTKIQESIPSEKAFTLINNNVLLSGENLFYTFYCRLQESFIPSNISKVAYVELLGKNNKVLFKHKLKLEEGFATGDFFIPPDVKTGHYKLVGYTQWMRNKGSGYSEKDLYIINPYVPLEKELDGIEGVDDNLYIDIRKSETLLASKSSQILKTDSEVYKPREHVRINLEDFSAQGNYMLSVRKIEALEITITGEQKKSKENSNNKFNLPELRGEIISGTLEYKDGKASSDKVLALSLPEKNFIFKNVETNASGKFIFNIHENYSSSIGFLQVLDSFPENYKIILDDKVMQSITSLDFGEIRLDKNVKSWLEKESVFNQIENAYNTSKLDSIIPRVSPKPFYGSSSRTYILDDYKRFPTLRETFVEVIEGAGIRSKKNGYVFKVYYSEEYDRYNFEGYPPLVLLDGVPVQDNQFLVDYDPYKIEEISLIRGNYFLGPKIYNGIIDIRSKKVDALTFDLKGLQKIELQLFNNQKLYYMPDYAINGDALKRIPDYRRQLLWVPINVKQENVKDIFLYTSDVEGVYQVSLKGYTANGGYVNIATHFEVRK